MSAAPSEPQDDVSEISDREEETALPVKHKKASKEDHCQSGSSKKKKKKKLKSKKKGKPNLSHPRSLGYSDVILRLF